jgi:hypothetical protein
MIAAGQGEADDATIFSPLEPRLTLLADDLMWWTAALAAGRAGDHVN